MLSLLKFNLRLVPQFAVLFQVVNWKRITNSQAKCSQRFVPFEEAAVVSLNFWEIFLAELLGKTDTINNLIHNWTLKLLLHLSTKSTLCFILTLYFQEILNETLHSPVRNYRWIKLLEVVLFLVRKILFLALSFKTKIGVVGTVCLEFNTSLCSAF